MNDIIYNVVLPHLESVGRISHYRVRLHTTGLQRMIDRAIRSRERRSTAGFGTVEVLLEKVVDPDGSIIWDREQLKEE